MWQEFGIAVALVLVIEGMLPFMSPQRWRELMYQAASLNNRSLRMVGLMSMLSGLVLLYWVR